MIKTLCFWGTRVAQSVKHPSLARVMISWLMSLSPATVSVLTAQSLGACFRFGVSLSLCPSPACMHRHTYTHTLSLSKLNLKNIKKKKEGHLGG